MASMKSNQIVLVVAVLVVAAGFYWYFFTGTGAEDQQTLIVGAEENPAQTRFRMLVSELQPIKFDTSIFNDSNFMALTSLSTQVAPEASGRLDPFAAIPGVSEK